MGLWRRRRYGSILSLRWAKRQNLMAALTRRSHCTREGLNVFEIPAGFEPAYAALQAAA